MDITLSLRPSQLCMLCWRALRARAAYNRNPASLSRSRQSQRRFKGYIAPAGEQAWLLKGFYADLLDVPLHQVQPATRMQPVPPSPEKLPLTKQEETLAKARVIFGSRTPDAGERKEKIEKGSRIVAGVKVPPRPTEPDNCCMSGCVNCVWDMYGEELEEWAAKSEEARVKMQAQKKQEAATGSTSSSSGAPSQIAVSMDDDGGGSETNWTASRGSPEDLFANIPVEIREFMRTEKMLKQKHAKESSASA